MTQLVEDLLLLARHDARAAEMAMEPVDPEILLSRVCEELRGVAEAKHIRIRQTSFADRGALITGNHAALRRLFLVLLDNAIKYSHTGSEVIVGIGHLNAEVVVTVEDFGIGISQTDRPHIFKRFYQADKARSDSGFGLGLSLADSIVKAHGAAIEVRSEEGRGTKFRVIFGERQPATRYDSLAAVGPAGPDSCQS